MPDDAFYIIGDAELISRLEGYEGEADLAMREFVEDVSGYAESAAEREAPKRTRTLASSVYREGPERHGEGDWKAEVGARARHSIWVQGGTGIWGPTGMPIRARPGNVLTFDVGGTTVFTRSVKGQEPNEFIERAYEETQHVKVPGALARLGQRLGGL